MSRTTCQMIRPSPLWQSRERSGIEVHSSSAPAGELYGSGHPSVFRNGKRIDGDAVFMDALPGATVRNLANTLTKGDGFIVADRQWQRSLERGGSGVRSPSYKPMRVGTSLAVCGRADHQGQRYNGRRIEPVATMSPVVLN